MNLSFEKYHGTGNDFIIMDIRNHAIPFTTDMIAHLCDRHYGIGADGFILLDESESYDFSMRYFNADGREASLCGNGGRCITAFAHRHGLIGNDAHFTAFDGEHKSRIISISGDSYRISLEMGDVVAEAWSSDSIFLDTGSPHYILMTHGLKDYDVFAEGRKLRHDERFAPEGTNVNFIEYLDDGLHIRTYERGVEDETLSCGTGATAAGLAWAIKNNLESYVDLQARGGQLRVSFKRLQGNFTEVRLEGPAEYVFSGQIELKDHDIKKPATQSPRTG